MSVLDLQGMPQTRNGRDDDHRKHASHLPSLLAILLSGCF
jgi:hypothetical protein